MGIQLVESSNYKQIWFYSKPFPEGIIAIEPVTYPLVIELGLLDNPTFIVDFQNVPRQKLPCIGGFPVFCSINMLLWFSHIFTYFPMIFPSFIGDFPATYDDAGGYLVCFLTHPWGVGDDRSDEDMWGSLGESHEHAWISYSIIFFPMKNGSMGISGS